MQMGTIDCPTCGMHFSLDDADDVTRAHPRHCRRFLDLQARHGVKKGADREADKSRGHELVLHGKTVTERVEGALLLLKAWFDRYVLNHNDEPSFEQYIAGYNLEREFGWADGVVDELRRKYGKAEIRWP